MSTSRLICILFSATAAALAESPPNSILLDPPNTGACTETLRWDTLPAPPPGITILRLVPHGSKRLFGIIPNYRADQYQTVYQPLNSRQKFKIARKDSFDWPNYFLLAGYAFQSQVGSGGFSHNGGLGGFGKFYARAAGDQIIGAYLTEAILPTWLHEDPRYFRLGTGSFWHRVFYAASRIAITRNDDGRKRLFVSELAGNAAVVAITSAYYPTSQTASEAFERYSQQLGNDAVSNILTEFWPDMKRNLHF